MRLNENKQGDLLILEIQGRLDSISSPETEKRLTVLIDSGARQIVFDLSGMEYLSSAGLRVFLTAAKRMQEAHGKLALSCIKPQVQQIINMAGFSTFLPIFATLPEAVENVTAAVTGQQASAATPLAHGLLSFAEEMFLLALDDHKGELNLWSNDAFNNALAAAMLMELALCGRLDTDLTALTVTSADPTGDPLLDEVLRELQQQSTPRTTAFWLKRLANWSGHIEERVLAGLVRKKILKQENRRILWVFEKRRYPLVDNREIKEVRLRLRGVILSNEIPDPRDIVLICLGSACRLLDDLFTPSEASRAHSRIADLSRLDLIGREMSRIIYEIEHEMTLSLRGLKI